MKKKIYKKPTATAVDIESHPLMQASGEDKKYNIAVDGTVVAPDNGSGAIEGNPDEIDAKQNSGISWDW